MKKPVTYLGDAFFHLTLLFAVICCTWVLITPAKYFVANEIERFFQNKGEFRAKSKYNELLAKKNITRDNFYPTIVVRKKNRELTVYANQNSNMIPIASYPVGLGRSAVGPKRKIDDMKTPEGDYFICNKVLNHKFHLFLQLNFPSLDDATRATVNHIISTQDEIRINQAVETGNPPPADTNLGGELGLHGYGAECCWTTDGSISMHNVDIEDLFWNIPENTPIMILP